MKKETQKKAFLDLEKGNRPYIEAVEESIKGHQKSLGEKNKYLIYKIFTNN